METHLFSLPLPQSPDAAPLAVLRQRPTTVLHRVHLDVTLNAASHTGVDVYAPPTAQMHPVAQRGLSNRMATTARGTCDRAGIGATNCAITPLTRTARAVVERLNAVAESGFTPNALAPKAIVTVARPWITRHPGDQGRAALSLSTTVGSDGLIAYRRLTKGARHVTPSLTPLLPLPGAAFSATGDARTPIMRRHVDGRLINQPQGGSIGVAQTESRAYRIAGDVRSTRRNFMRLAVADGVVTQQEDAIDRSLQAIEEALEQKADDERAAIALIRTGRTKHTRGIVVDLFPSIGPEAA